MIALKDGTFSSHGDGDICPPGGQRRRSARRSTMRTKAFDFRVLALRRLQSEHLDVVEQRALFLADLRFVDLARADSVYILFDLALQLQWYCCPLAVSPFL